MPKDYSKAKLYRLVSSHTDEEYIGSTCVGLSQRKAKHLSHYNDWKNGKHDYVSSFKLFEIGSVDIVLLEEYPCENNEQLRKREREAIEKAINDGKKIINIIRRPYISESERKEEIQIYGKQYREANKEKIIQYQDKNKDKYNELRRIRYENNKDEENERCRRYKQNNKEKIKEYDRKYREEHEEEIKEKRKIKIICEICSKETNKRHLKRHQSSKYCKSFFILSL